MNIVTSYFMVKRIPGSLFLGEASLKYRTIRQEEYLNCIRRNIIHTEVNSLHLLIEGLKAYYHFREHILENDQFLPCKELKRKIIPIVRPEIQSTYADLFQYANKLLHGKLTMICNADVYIPQIGASVKRLEEIFNCITPHPIAIALTRYESENPHDAPLIDNYRGSHDAFIIRPPVENIFINNVQHLQNCYKAENVVIYELQRHGYIVLNPCRSFMLVHHHKADLRQWLPAVDEERYAQALPCTLEEAINMLKQYMHNDNKK